MPETVHIFISIGRFKSFEEMRSYIEETYNGDGEGFPSLFMREVGLSQYEPGCIEAIPSVTGQVVSLSVLLRDASWADKWLPQVDGSRLADAAICVFEPNQLSHPERCSLEYLGGYQFALQ